MKRFAIALLAALLAAGAQTTDEAGRLLKAAQNTELVDGNLNAAIKQYGAIVARYAKKDRAATATALVRMAECYQKTGDAQSRKLYEQVVSEYADQKDAVAIARARLGSTPISARKTTALVWTGPHVGTDGTVSSDGRYLSYTDWDTGDLAVHDFAAGQDRHITDTGNKGDGWKTYAEESAISPDGKQVAYSWYDRNNGKRYELRIANLTGDPNPRRLYDNPSVAWLTVRDWSPDGRYLAVLLTLKDETYQIGLLSVADGSLRVLKSGRWRGDDRMFFSPDSKYLAYSISEGDVGPERHIFVMALDGAREMPAVTTRGHKSVMGWSPDGKQLLFVSDRTGSLALYALAFANGSPRGAPELVSADLGQVESLGLTRAGALYYGSFTARAATTVQVSSFDFASGRLVSSPREVTQDYMESNEQPHWSRDGKYLAYVSRRGRMLSENVFLVIRPAEGGPVVRELQLRLTGYTLAGWAPDGRSLLARARDIDKRWGVFSIDAQTGDVSPLILDSPNQSHAGSPPAWSPDGKLLYFSRTFSDTGETAFYRRNMASGTETELIRRSFLGYVNLSPDGRYIATGSRNPSAGSRTMLVIPTDGGEPREGISVRVDPGDLGDNTKGEFLSGVIWAPDSRSFLTFKQLADRKKDRETWQVPIDGSAPHKVDGTLANKLGPFRLHPDGRQIAYVVTEPGPRPDQEVWVLEHFLPKQ